MTDDTPTAGGIRPRRVVQIAYAVDDIRRAAADWNRLTGAGPFFVFEHIPVKTAIHDGRPAVFDHSTACGQWGDVMLELVTHHHVEPPELAAAVRGRGGINHVAWFVEDLGAETERLVNAGAQHVLEADTGTIRFSFFDPGPAAGHLIECYEPTGFLPRLYDAVRNASEDWDGVDPVRAGSQLPL